MNKLFVPGMILVAVWLVYGQLAPISRAPGVLVHDEPVQELLPSTLPPVELKGWSFKKLASYQIKARVLSKEHYVTDPMAEIAPYDLAVGWGRMSDTAVLEQFDIRQRFRRFSWTYWGNTPPIPVTEIECHASNMHLIAADDRVASEISGLRKGSLVLLSGFLVEAKNNAQPAHPWRSSLSRKDTGDGACEVMLVTLCLELD